MKLRALGVLLASTIVQAHMRLNYPPPFNAPNNPHTKGEGDPQLDYPYNCCGNNDGNVPCRGYLKFLGTSEGAPVASWIAGSRQNFNLTGSGNHYGGSCQVGFSTDGGRTFHVASSYEGNCPLRNGGSTPEGQNFEFTVPRDLPPGDAVFAWSWANREQEFYMNCAAVTITSDGRYAAPESPPSSTARTESVPPPTGSQTTESPSASHYPGTHLLEGCKCNCSNISGGPSTYIAASGCACTCSSRKSSGAKRRVRARHLGHPHHYLRRRLESVAFNDRPNMLMVDTNDGCLSPRSSAELKYPHPGPDIVEGDGEYPLRLPTPAEKCGY